MSPSQAFDAAAAVCAICFLVVLGAVAGVGAALCAGLALATAGCLLAGWFLDRP